jgi:putative transposase
MGKRRSAEPIQRLLREADRDLARGLMVGDVCRKLGISGNTYYRWRQVHDPAEVDDARHVRELRVEVDRHKFLVAELMLDKQMLQDAKKGSGEGHPSAGGRRVPGRRVPDLRTAVRPGAWPSAVYGPQSASAAGRGRVDLN